jgi:hypothetical protein
MRSHGRLSRKPGGEELMRRIEAAGSLFTTNRKIRLLPGSISRARKGSVQDLHRIQTKSKSYPHQRFRETGVRPDCFASGAGIG